MGSGGSLMRNPQISLTEKCADGSIANFKEVYTYRSTGANEQNDQAILMQDQQIKRIQDGYVRKTGNAILRVINGCKTKSYTDMDFRTGLLDIRYADRCEKLKGYDIKYRTHVRNRLVDMMLALHFIEWLKRAVIHLNNEPFRNKNGDLIPAIWRPFINSLSILSSFAQSHQQFSEKVVRTEGIVQLTKDILQKNISDYRRGSLKRVI